MTKASEAYRGREGMKGLRSSTAIRWDADLAWPPSQGDEDEDYVPAGSFAEAWERSFTLAAPSLEAWLEAWLDQPDSEELQRIADAEAVKIRQASLDLQIARLAAKTPQERAALGLSENWEEELRQAWR
ncbi:MAG TPA: hypothetical protein VGD10_09530 [Allosphingosinicella sp.]|uniref:hypothetical protein n=1 Tax=Allosphingosinicella sp. TaxID=2823234 RepID=UPI002ED9871B